MNITVTEMWQTLFPWVHQILSDTPPQPYQNLSLNLIAGVFLTT